MEQRRSLEFLARAYARSQREAGVVSVARAARAIATLLPDCELTGRELDEAIARYALAERRSVAFDRLGEVT
jgi:hypothetical protein